jgi:1,4-dihydroxy-2-naphthoate octaprenyltransferase
MRKVNLNGGSGSDSESVVRDTLKLMRIPFSYFLMPVFLFALSQSRSVDYVHAALCFIALHLFIYPASNGYNSYMDQDEGPIGGLKNPPRPTKKLFYLALAFDAAGLLLSLFVSLAFFVSAAAYLLSSRAYSYKGIRLKKMPLAGFLTVVCFQGGFTYWMVLCAISRIPVEASTALLAAMVSCSFIIAGVYPLTQIYQHEADLSNGDVTISSRLGYKGTFLFSALMFACAGILMAFYFYLQKLNLHFLIFQLFLIPVFVYFSRWYLKVARDVTEASFENTMRMNLIASTSMNLYFITLFILNLNR